VLPEEQQRVTGGTARIQRRRGRSTFLVPCQQVQAGGAAAGVDPEPPVKGAGHLEGDGVRSDGTGAPEMMADQQRAQLGDQVIEGDRV
jgi:hypothetical protein